MEKEINIGPFIGNIYEADGKICYTLQFEICEVVGHYHDNDEKFLEKIEETGIYLEDADLWEDMIPMILEKENRHNLLDISEDSVSGGSDTYMVFLKNEETLMEYLTFLDELLKDKKRFLKYLKKMEI